MDRGAAGKIAMGGFPREDWTVPEIRQTRLDLQPCEEAGMPGVRPWPGFGPWEDTNKVPNGRPRAAGLCLLHVATLPSRGNSEL